MFETVGAKNFSPLQKQAKNYLEAVEKRNSPFGELQLEWWRE